MTTFETPHPISVTVEFGVGDLLIDASDRSDTVVEVHPSDPAKKSDVTAADNVRVEYDGGRLVVKASKGWRQFTPRGAGESISVQISLPEDSEVRATAGVAAIRCQGRLGECRLTTGIGELEIDETGGPVGLKTGMGDITVGRSVGSVDVSTGTGTVRIHSINGSAVVKNSNGDTWIGEVDGELRANAANGKIVVDQARATVAARTANGDVRLRQVGSGVVVAETARGKIDIGVLDGVAAWLDLNTRFGTVHSDLDAVENPDSDDATVEVRARTSFGDVTVRRALVNVLGRG